MIGVFDSGVGGLSVLAEIRREIPTADLLYFADQGRAPYGVRALEEVARLSGQVSEWLIDHGATLYFHHDWNDYLARSQTPFPMIRQHVLLRFASQLRATDEALRPRLTPTILQEIVEEIPAVWLGEETLFADHAEHRAAYLAYLTRRLAAAPLFVEEAVRAHAEHL